MNYQNHKIAASQVNLTMPNESWISLTFNGIKNVEKRFLLAAISLALLICIVLSLMLTSNMPTNSTNSTNSTLKVAVQINTLGNKHLKFVAELLSGQFKYGSWRYINSELTDNKIKSYIQIPLKLQMEKDYQRNYIKKALCPNNDHPLWKHIEQSQLEIHLYTGYKHNSVYAKCG